MFRSELLSDVKQHMRPPPPQYWMKKTTTAKTGLTISALIETLKQDLGFQLYMTYSMYGKYSITTVFQLWKALILER